jgi:hypothetical protein
MSRPVDHDNFLCSIENLSSVASHFNDKFNRHFSCLTAKTIRHRFLMPGNICPETEMRFRSTAVRQPKCVTEGIALVQKYNHWATALPGCHSANAIVA